MERISAKAIHAVIIGIDAYLPSPLCEPLYGAVADADAMDGFLLARGVPPANLSPLTASRGPDGSLIEPFEERPTYESMVRAIRHQGRAAAKAGGVLVIHYSGHGGRTPTLIPATKGAEGLDEGLLPYDIADPEARILRDVEISYLMAELSARGVPVVLIVDACHSGGILRDESLVRVRAARGIDLVARRRDSDVAPVDVLESRWRRLHRRAFEKLPARAGQAVAVPGALGLGPSASLLAACRAHEAAYEVPTEDGIRGALTSALLEVLVEGATLPSWERFQRCVTYRIRRRGLYQTPVFEGEPSEVLFGFLRKGTSRTLRIMDVDREQDLLRIDAGRAFGLDPGARLEIVPRDARTEALGAFIVEVESSDASSALARPCQGDLATIEPGDKALMVDPGVGRRRRVMVVPEAVLPSTEVVPGRTVFRDGRLLSHLENRSSWQPAVTRALASRPQDFLEGVSEESGLVPDFRVVLDPAGVYKILELDGRPVTNLPPLVAASPEAARRLVDQLIHLARFYAVRDLDSPSAHGSTRASIAAEIGRLPSGFVLGEDLNPEPCVEVLPRIRDGESLCLTIANNSQLTLHLYVLDLRPDWSVRLLHPRRGVETLPTDQLIRLPFLVSLPDGIRKGLASIKVIATTRPANVDWLELPAIKPAETLMRGDDGSAAEPGHGVDLRDAVTRGTAGFWVTDQVDFEIVS